MPSLDLGLPVYNGARFIGPAIESIMRQTFRNFTLTILDNASTDATPDICRSFEAQDSRIRYLRREANVGARSNFNDAYHAGDAKYFKWCAHDDLLEPTYLEACLAVLEARDDVVLCHSRTELISITGDPLLADPTAEEFVDWRGVARSVRPVKGRGASPDPFRRFVSIVCYTSRAFDVFGVIRRDALAQTKLVRSYYGSDITLLAELSLHGRFHEIPETLFYKREHAGQSRSLRTAAARSKWMDPQNPRWHSLILGRNTWSLTGAVLRSPIPTAKKIRCIAMLIAIINWLAPLKLVGVDVKAIRRQRRARELSVDPAEPQDRSGTKAQDDGSGDDR